MDYQWTRRRTKFNLRLAWFVIVCSVALIAVPSQATVAIAAPSAENMSPAARAEKTLDRNLEPVILNGASLEAFVDLSVDELFVYAYQGTTWELIPAQVDEVNGLGRYVATEDGIFDSNDEIVFMAADTGDQAPAAVDLSAQLPISATWYEIVVTDPVSATNQGWAYLVASSQISAGNPTDYVDFDDATSRILGESYTLGFATPNPWADYLTLGSSDVDLLDRNKLRVLCLIPGVCPLTEETGNVAVPNALIKDGNVRIIVRDGRVIGYGSMIFWSTSIPLSPLVPGPVHITFDFSPEASGSTLYNEAAPAGVTVDGSADTMPATPASTWFQLSTSEGTIIQVANLAGLGGTPTLTNFYLDDATPDANDTGDGMHYGEIGAIAEYPAGAFPSSLTYNFNLYALPGDQPNVGSTYQAYYVQTLEPSATRVTAGEAPTTSKLYVPSLFAENN